MISNAKVQGYIDQVVQILLLLTSLAALKGVYQAHFATGGATFGSTTGSLSLIAFAITVTLWQKAASK